MSRTQLNGVIACMNDKKTRRNEYEDVKIDKRYLKKL